MKDEDRQAVGIADLGDGRRSGFSRLLSELEQGSGDGVDLGTSSGGDAPAGPHPARQNIDLIEEALFADSPFRLDESIINEGLEEILLVLISMRTEDTNGKTLMSDLIRLFDAQLSPGTVYPTLHELEQDETLEMFELVRSKEYRVEDRAAARSKVTEAARQFLALGAFFYLSAGDL
ncbi:helix-turn-helix transcriptional regulator [Natronomonas marina]|jgi:hypothetical protein|uniref:helix-turn-helix transcriptional regulator n=1 Tax=Natronomonas marina TaxID=2961939 RepID=UPI0020CA205C|nr:helix-turn-helix transcriptional regulator [Natronomonas marina]